MAFQATKLTSLFRNPAKQMLGVIEGLDKEGKVLSFLNERTNDGWLKVSTPEGEVGWVFSGDVTEVPDPKPLPVDEAGYVRSALIAEHILNAQAGTGPWFVSADFVIARAIFETDIANGTPAAGPDTTGPLQVSVREWEDFLAKAGDFKTDYTGGGPAWRHHTNSRRNVSDVYRRESVQRRWQV